MNAAGFKIQSELIHSHTDFVPSILTEHTPLCMAVKMTWNTDLPENAEFVLTAHEIFSETTKALYSNNIDELDHLMDQFRENGPGSYQLLLPQKTLKLEPGCWHLMVDVMVEKQSLAQNEVGSAVVYVRFPGESPEHARASYNLARAEFAFDRQYGIYYKCYRDALPPSIDPFSDEAAAKFRREFVTEEKTWPELQHDGGLGFLFAAHVYHTLGEPERATYCEETLHRIIHTIQNVMWVGDGRLAAVSDVENERSPLGHSRQQDALALKFLAQMYFYFRFGPGDNKDYAREILHTAGEMFRYQLDLPLEPGCAGQCRVYDGRILAGMTWYCLAHKAEHGLFFSPDAQGKLLSTAAEFAGEVISNEGWYDSGCLVEGKCHIWCGNLNIINGLLPALTMARSLCEQSHDLAEQVLPQLETGLRSAFTFLTRTNGAVTGQTAFVPTRTSQWAAGNMYEICDHYLNLVEDDEGVRQLRDRLLLGAGAQIVSCFHRNNTSGALMLHCPEFQALKSKTPLPWDHCLKTID
ncbi:MAG: hypothetical protein ACLFWL_01775 [Candidatus Brocadiia bacterium]